MTESGKRPYSVALFGIEPFERAVLRRIFALSEARPKQYALANGAGADIHLVDRDNPQAAEQWQAAQAAVPGTPTVMVAREAPPGCSHHLRRPFVATRLLRALDSLVEEGAGAAPPRAAPAPRPARAAPAPRYRALVVDDSLAVRTQVSRALARAAIDAEVADSGEAALALIERGTFDIVFLDVTMPGMDGYEVCRIIKRNKERKHIPVVMLTGRSSPFDRVKGKLSGCDSYLAKPVSRDDFVGTLEKHLKVPVVLA